MNFFEEARDQIENRKKKGEERRRHEAGCS